MEIRANALAVMAKAPVPGQVKTRLLPLLTAEEAAELSRSLLVDQLNQVKELDTADFYLAFAPDDARLLMEHLAPACFHLFPQQCDELGARMAAVFKKLFDEEVEKFVLKYLQKHDGKLAPAAAELGIMNPTLRRIARAAGK